jgi:hypothetical protein
MRITLKNDYHGTETTVLTDSKGRIKATTIKQAEKKLCGMDDCRCGGIRGQQDHEIRQINSRGDFEVID